MYTQEGFNIDFVAFVNQIIYITVVISQDRFIDFGARFRSLIRHT